MSIYFPIITPQPRISIPSSNSNDPGYIVQPGTGLDGVVQMVGSDNHTCSGALLTTGRHILTVAHCVTNEWGEPDYISPSEYTVYFNLPSGKVSIPVSQIYIHPEWDSDINYNNDIAILELSQPAPEAANRYEIYTGFDEIGQTIQKVGYGRIATGNLGQNTTSDVVSTKRMGFNRYDAFGELFNTDPYDYNMQQGKQFVYDFDNGLPQNDAFGQEFNINDLGFGLSEVSISPGDSGGPAFINGKIAGLTSTGFPSAKAGIDVTNTLDSSFGEYASDTRVSVFADWINQIINTAFYSGDDHNIGTINNDFLYGYQGNDTLQGLQGDDDLFGGKQDDHLYGDEGNDNLYGNLGLDFIYGGFGNDFLMGGQESDFLYGEAGNDTLSGDLGTDYLTGGLDSDLFILSLADANSDPTLADIITDFEPAFDQIGLTDGLTPANLTLELSIDPYLYSSKTLIRVTGSNQILGIVANISPEQLQDHFLSI
jgi:Ca2+-binding RTX toxin-like protein